MILRTSLSVACMESRPMLVRLWMVSSTSSEMMPSADVTAKPCMASMADIIAVLTPLDIFIEQEGFAPSQIIPVRLATIFLTASHTCLYPPPIR